MGAAVEKGAGHDLKRGIEDKWNGEVTGGSGSGAPLSRLGVKLLMMNQSFQQDIFNILPCIQNR
jgi:hypothetical protein